MKRGGRARGAIIRSVMLESDLPSVPHEPVVAAAYRRLNPHGRQLFSQLSASSHPEWYVPKAALRQGFVLAS
jgi:hypothetical protein